ncbi:MarC family protein [Candidatus Woesearchaeota archaeon]|nr:MarC family protein [Candidatus Woesearchaeota archaeon]
MVDPFFQLLILFFVIFDPLASFVIFTVATNSMQEKERQRTATIAVMVAAGISFLVLLFGEGLLQLFSMNIEEFQVAGGIVLSVLGLKMVLGNSLVDVERVKGDSSWAIASIIGTPLLTGPAAIMSIIVSANNYGKLVTGLAVGIVLVGTVILFYNTKRVSRILGRTAIQVVSTILGLITLAWGVKYVLQAI